MVHALGLLRLVMTTADARCPRRWRALAMSR
jgi:hypothetical protein